MEMSKAWNVLKGAVKEINSALLSDEESNDEEKKLADEKIEDVFTNEEYARDFAKCSILSGDRKIRMRNLLFKQNRDAEKLNESSLSSSLTLASSCSSLSLPDSFKEGKKAFWNKQEKTTSNIFSYFSRSTPCVSSHSSSLSLPAVYYKAPCSSHKPLNEVVASAAIPSFSAFCSSFSYSSPHLNNNFSSRSSSSNVSPCLHSSSGVTSCDKFESDVLNESKKEHFKLFEEEIIKEKNQSQSVVHKIELEENLSNNNLNNKEDHEKNENLFIVQNVNNVIQPTELFVRDRKEEEKIETNENEINASNLLVIKNYEDKSKECNTVNHAEHKNENILNHFEACSNILDEQDKNIEEANETFIYQKSDKDILDELSDMKIKFPINTDNTQELTRSLLEYSERYFNLLDRYRNFKKNMLDDSNFKNKSEMQKLQNELFDLRNQISFWQESHSSICQSLHEMKTDNFELRNKAQRLEVVELELAQTKHDLMKMQEFYLSKHNLEVDLTEKSLKLSDLEKQVEEKQNHINKLDQFIEEMQKENEMQVKRMENDISILRNDCRNLKKQILNLKEIENEKLDMERRIAEFDDIKNELNREILTLSVDNNLLKEGIEKLLEKIRIKEEEKENYIDKRIMVQMITQYMQKNQNSYRRDEIFSLIFDVIGFTKEQKIELGLLKQNEAKKLSDQFVEFLDIETTKE